MDYMYVWNRVENNWRIWEIWHLTLSFDAIMMKEWSWKCLGAKNLPVFSKRFNTVSQIEQTISSQLKVWHYLYIYRITFSTGIVIFLPLLVLTAIDVNKLARATLGCSGKENYYQQRYSHSTCTQYAAEFQCFHCNCCTLYI